MIQSDIQNQLKPLVEQLGFEFWGCEYVPQGRHALLRIYIDSEQGIGITDCTQVSRQISAFLDVEDLIKDHYSLEVSSPGIPRPLFFLEQYPRYIGQIVQLKLRHALNGSRKIQALLVAVNETTIQIRIGEECCDVAYSNIVKANVTGE